MHQHRELNFKPITNIWHLYFVISVPKNLTSLPDSSWVVSHLKQETTNRLRSSVKTTNISVSEHKYKLRVWNKNEWQVTTTLTEMNKVVSANRSQAAHLVIRNKVVGSVVWTVGLVKLINRKCPMHLYDEKRPREVWKGFVVLSSTTDESSRNRKNKIREIKIKNYT